nr:hypothetical protein [Tanacetum cinerariifolium]
PVDAKNWISHMEKIFDVMGFEDAFKTRLAVYKFEGDALAWWKAYKQAKGGDERLKKEYHSIRQTDTETSTEFMQHFLQLAGFLRAAAGTAEEQEKNFQGVTIMVSEPGYETVGSKDLTCEDWIVNIRTDADLSAAVQNTLQTLLPQICEEIREEFHTSSGTSDAAPVDVENWICHMEKIFDVMGCEDAFKTRLAVYKFEGYALAWWKSYKQAKGGAVEEGVSLYFARRILRLARSFAAFSSTCWFPWSSCWYRGGAGKELLVANTARNYEILHERDDDDTERPDKRQKSGDRHQPTSQQSIHRNHSHNNDRHGSDWRGGGDNHRNNNNYSGNNNRNSDNGRDQRSRDTLQTLLPQIHAEIREEFCTSSGSSNACGHPPPVTIHTWLERFNKQKPHSFEKATAPVDA